MSNINEFKKLGAVAQAYKDMLEEQYKKKKMKEETCPDCGQEPCVCEQEIPEELSKEDASDFVVAAAAAKKAGKKKFSFGGKEYPVTIKTDVKTEESDQSDDDDEEEVKTKKKTVEINPETSDK